MGIINITLKIIYNNQYNNQYKTQNNQNSRHNQYITPNDQIGNQNNQYNRNQQYNNPINQYNNQNNIYYQNGQSNQNQNISSKPPTTPKTPPKQMYYFPEKGLYSIGSTCYMNATFQCLLHVCELIAYFLNEYPNDFVNLKKKNKDVESQENISKAFYDLIKGVISDENDDNKKGKGISIFSPKTSFGTKMTGIFSFGGLGIFGRSTSPKAFSLIILKKY